MGREAVAEASIHEPQARHVDIKEQSTNQWTNACGILKKSGEDGCRLALHVLPQFRLQLALAAGMPRSWSSGAGAA